MKISKKVLSVTMSMVMLGTQAMPVLADDAASTAPTTTGGTANILDYAIERVVVPTALKITLNPNKYGITTGYEKAATYAAGTVYYEKKADGSYEKMATQPTSFAAGTDYYTAVTSNTQVVSLNYGIANKSTEAKTVKVDFAATYTEVAGKTAIEFVDSKEKAEAYDETNKPNGAKAGEHKMYLAVASATAAPTANTHKKTEDTSLNNSKTYYTKGADGSFTKVGSPAVGDLGTYYEDATEIGTEITAAELSDVTMTPATTGNQVFAKGTDKADASIAYSLGAATYTVKDGETLDFATSQDDLKNKLEMSALGGVAGFTITGAVNPNADWTKADATAITITPTYTIADATGTEAAADENGGAYNQVTLETGPSAAATANFDSANGATFTVNFGSGDLAATRVDSIQFSTDGGTTYKAFGTPANVYTISGNTVTIKPTFGGFDSSNKGYLKVIFNKGDAAFVTLTKQ